MDAHDSFDLNEALKCYLNDTSSIPTPEADSVLQDCENEPESLTSSLINSVLNPIIDAIAENPEALSRSSIFDSLQFLLKCAPIFLPTSRSPHKEASPELFELSRQASQLPTAILGKLFDLIVSGLSSQVDATNSEGDSDDQESLRHSKSMLERYAFLLQWSVAVVEVKAAERPANPTARGRASKSSKAKAASKDGEWDSTLQLQASLDVMCKCMRLKLGKIFVTTSERDTFIGLFTRSVYLVLESEQRVKATSIRMHAFKVICLAVKNHGHAFGAQTSIIQNLTYFEHLAEPMAELLHIMSEQYDHAQLTDEILRELGNKEFNNNDTRGPKSVSAFLVKLSELTPRLILKQMMLLISQLDSESYNLRCAIIEVCGNLIADLSKQEERNENSKSQINAFFEILEERFLDINPYCRCRTIQVYVKLCDLEQKFPKRRQIATELATRSLEDKSSNVRRNSIKLLGKLVSTHPFSVMHGGQLSLGEWDERLRAVEKQMDALKPPAGSPGLAEKGKDEATVDSILLDDATTQNPEPEEKPMTQEEKLAAMEKAAEEAATSDLLTKLQLTRKYYNEAMRFIETLHLGTPIVCQLLASKNKSEVIEAMDFFVILDAYKIEPARTGIRRMLRLIWTKGNSDEGKGVQTHLIDCYQGLFFTAPDSFSDNDAANFIARNMTSLTFGATPAELTSLEQLLNTMVKLDHVSDLVISKLWQVYGVQRQEISKNQRQGAIIILGMLATAEPEIVIKEIGTLVRVGLGPLGRKDLALAKYTCLALARMQPTKQQRPESKASASKLPNDHVVLTQLASVVELVSDSKEWYGVAEQAIGAIYALARHPDTLCSEILRKKTKNVFQVDSKASGIKSEQSDDGQSRLPTPPPEEDVPAQSGFQALSQLLYIVGDVAIKQIVHLELCELDFKRRKADKEKNKASSSPVKKNSVDEQELDLIGGTTEDDFAEAMTHIREKELLYGQDALLSNFAPLVTELCSNNTAYPDESLQSAATLCMAKLMCVSSEYCEKNLPLLITILERSNNAITRNNLVIALGDMAVCFNHLIDENTDFLYRRLNDKDGSVKRTCLMTLTFLILAGQVKVKGQLGEMAKCLEDSDKRIADLSKMFFTELATKDNAVYNHFIDMFSLLSAERELEEDEFRRIIKFLSAFIEKDKHAKQLADKLASRLQRCDTERQWNDVAYALSLLQHKNEDINQKLSEGFQIIQAAA